MYILSFFFRFIPVFLQIFIINLLIKLCLRGQMAEEARLDKLEGAVFVIKLTDMMSSFFININNRKLYASSKILKKADFSFEGKLPDFIKMFLKYDDPDSLFFSRRLIIEGDVEKSVLFKNILQNL